MLEGRLNTTASFQGTVHASEHAIRYQAPDRPGEYSAVYTVGNEYGETVSATVTFAVHQRDADSKNHPNRAISKPESPQAARYASPSHLAASTMPTT